MKIYRTMHHRGGLEESLKTVYEIDIWLAEYLINIGVYKKYTYDERIKAQRYIFTGPMEEQWKVPDWLLEIDIEEK